MKAVFVISIIAFFPISLFGQVNEKEKSIESERENQFKAILFKGNVKSIALGEILKIESKFSVNDSLEFELPDGFLVVINEKKSTFLLRPAKKKKGYSTHPIPARVNTRPGKIVNYFDFYQFLEDLDFLVLGGETSIEVGEKEFPMDENHFFYVQYKWSGSKGRINKKLPFRGNKLVFSKEKIFMVEGRSINPNDVQDYVLFYYDQVKKESLEINNLNLVFPNEPQLIQEITAILNSYPSYSNEKEKTLEIIKKIIFFKYGIPGESNFQEWMAHNFDWF